MPTKRIIVAIVLLPLCLPAQTSNANKIDSLFKHFGKDSIPGLALAVVKDGSAAYSRGFGFADIAEGEKTTAATPFWIASVTKQFTAAGIYLMALGNSIKLADPVRKYLPALPAMFDSVTIEQLVHHTSGI